MVYHLKKLHMVLKHKHVPYCSVLRGLYKVSHGRIAAHTCCNCLITLSGSPALPGLPASLCSLPLMVINNIVLNQPVQLIPPRTYF